MSAQLPRQGRLSQSMHPEAFQWAAAGVGTTSGAAPRPSNTPPAGHPSGAKNSHYGFISPDNQHQQWWLGPPAARANGSQADSHSEGYTLAQPPAATSMGAQACAIPSEPLQYNFSPRVNAAQGPALPQDIVPAFQQQSSLQDGYSGTKPWQTQQQQYEQHQQPQQQWQQQHLPPVGVGSLLCHQQVQGHTSLDWQPPTGPLHAALPVLQWENGEPRQTATQLQFPRQLGCPRQASLTEFEPVAYNPSLQVRLVRGSSANSSGTNLAVHQASPDVYSPPDTPDGMHAAVLHRHWLQQHQQYSRFHQEQSPREHSTAAPSQQHHGQGQTQADQPHMMQQQQRHCTGQPNTSTRLHIAACQQPQHAITGMHSLLQAPIHQQVPPQGEPLPLVTVSAAGRKRSNNPFDSDHQEGMSANHSKTLPSAQLSGHLTTDNKQQSGPVAAAAGRDDHMHIDVQTGHGMMPETPFIANNAAASSKLQLQVRAQAFAQHVDSTAPTGCAGTSVQQVYAGSMHLEQLDSLEYHHQQQMQSRQLREQHSQQQQWHQEQQRQRQQQQQQLQRYPPATAAACRRAASDTGARPLPLSSSTGAISPYGFNNSSNAATLAITDPARFVMAAQYAPALRGPGPYMASGMAGMPMFAAAAISPAAMLVPAAMYAAPAAVMPSAMFAPGAAAHPAAAAAAAQSAGYGGMPAEAFASSMGYQQMMPQAAAFMGMHPAVAAAAAAADAAWQQQMQQQQDSPGPQNPFASPEPYIYATANSMQSFMVPTASEATPGQPSVAPEPDADSSALVPRVSMDVATAVPAGASISAGRPQHHWQAPCSPFWPLAAVAWLFGRAMPGQFETAATAGQDTAMLRGAHGPVAAAASAACSMVVAAHHTAAWGAGLVGSGTAALVRWYFMGLIYYGHYQLVVVLYILLGLSTSAFAVQQASIAAGSFAVLLSMQAAYFAARQARLFASSAARVVTSDLRQLPWQLVAHPLLLQPSNSRIASIGADSADITVASIQASNGAGSDSVMPEGRCKSGAQQQMEAADLADWLKGFLGGSSSSGGKLVSSAFGSALAAAGNAVSLAQAAAHPGPLQHAGTVRSAMVPAAPQATRAAAAGRPVVLGQVNVADSISVISGLWVGLGIKLWMLLAMRAPYESGRIWLAVCEQGCRTMLAALRAAVAQLSCVMWCLAQCSLLIIANTKVQVPYRPAAVVLQAMAAVAQAVALTGQVSMLSWTHVGSHAVVAGQNVVTRAASTVPGGLLLLQLLQHTSMLLASAAYTATSGAGQLKQWLLTVDEQKLRDLSMQHVAVQLLQFTAGGFMWCAGKMLLLGERAAVAVMGRVLLGAPPMAQAAVWGSAGMSKRLLVEASQQSWLLVQQLYRAWQQQQQSQLQHSLTG